MIDKIKEQVEIGNYGRAVDMINLLLRDDNNHAELLGLKGVSLIYQGLTKEGIEELGKSINISENLDFRYHRSIALFEEREFEKSLNDAEYIVSKAKDNIIYLENLGYLYQTLGYHEQCFSVSEQILSIDEENINGLDLQGYILIEQGNYNRAIACYKKLLALEYSEEHILNNLGYCYDRMGHYDEAIPYYKKLLEINPYHPFALNNLGLIICRKGEIKKGEIMIKKSIDYDPSNSYAYKNLGKAKMLQGKKEEAYKNLIKARELNYAVHYDDEVDEILNKEFNNV